MLRASGAAFDLVLSSLVAPLRRDGGIAGAGAGDAGARAERGLRDPRRRGRAMLVSHQVTITALTGVYPASGEIVAFRLAGRGVEVLDTVTTR